jgi:cytochrome c biogenesis protein CcmG/thiol:disulfide interchange protein DsbE
MSTVRHDPYDNTIQDVYHDTSVAVARRKISPFAIVVSLAVVLLLGVVGWGIYQNQQDTRTSGEAPDFSLKTYEGETLQLSSFKGENVVVLNFWQSNCPPCHDEAPMLNRVYAAYKDKGVVFIGINAKDPDKLALAYIAQYGIEYYNGLDIGDKIQGAYRTTGYPETFIIDREGNIQRHFNGPPSEAVLRAEIEKALVNS